MRRRLAKSPSACTAARRSLRDFETFLHDRFPQLTVACSISPPFRPLTEAEDEADVARINDSGARILFVGIGCPKQENWMAAHRGRVRCAMIGVGAAFDFFSGRKRHAPRWMQAAGLEWLFRLASDPRRLWNVNTDLKRTHFPY